MTTGRRRSARTVESPPYRSFDPRLVGRLECTAWVAYYRREWIRLLRAVVGLTRHTFGLPWPQTLYGAWLVLRANQPWAPLDTIPPARGEPCSASTSCSRRITTRPVTRRRPLTWRWSGGACNREHQRAGVDPDDGPLVDALPRATIWAARCSRRSEPR